MVERRATPEKVARARSLRAAPSAVERTLWQLLRGRQIAGFRFRRRSVVLGWIPDFWCPAAKLAIEIDGKMTTTKISRDRARDAHLRSQGIQTLHVRAEDVLKQPSRVIAQVAEALVAIKDAAGADA